MSKILIDTEKILQRENAERESEKPQKPHEASFPFKFAFWAAVGGYIGIASLLSGLHWIGFWVFGDLSLGYLVGIPAVISGVGLGIYSILLTVLAARNIFGQIFPQKETQQTTTEIVYADADEGTRIELALRHMIEDHYMFGDEVTREKSRVEPKQYNKANEILLNPFIGIRAGYGKGQKFVGISGPEELGLIYRAIASVSVSPKADQYTVNTSEGLKTFRFSGVQAEKPGSDTSKPGKRQPKKTATTPSPSA